jgi:hypothetical protein
MLRKEVDRRVAVGKHHIQVPVFGSPSLESRDHLIDKDIAEKCQLGSWFKVTKDKEVAKEDGGKTTVMDDDDDDDEDNGEDNVKSTTVATPHC